MNKFLLLLLVWSPLLVTAQENSSSIPMTAQYWEAEAGRVEFITHRGVPALKVTPSPDGIFIGPAQVVLKDVEFATGTIEFDVELADFFLSTIYFRRENATNSELFYLRKYRADNPTGPDGIQYTTLTKGVALWDLYPDYQAPATFYNEGWNRVKLVVSEKRMRVYVNDMEVPSITIPELMGDSEAGGIAFEGGGIFANLSIKHGVTNGLNKDAAFDPVKEDIRYLHHWQVSEPFDLPPGREMVSAMLFRAHSDHLPDEQTKWHKLEAERSGLVNLSRLFGKSDERRAAWLKTTIHSNIDQQRMMDFGFSDEVWVLLNDQLVYVDKNLYSNPIMKHPFGQMTINDTSFSLPLKEGENELLIGVANSFFGWAIMARLRNMDGIVLK